jgi:hypothetical protein
MGLNPEYQEVEGVLEAGVEYCTFVDDDVPHQLPPVVVLDKTDEELLP